MKLKDLQAGDSFDDALAQAIAVMCEGLVGAPLSIARQNPVAVDRSVAERLETTLQRTRDSQSAVVARAYADRVSQTAEGAPVKVGHRDHAAGQRASTELFRGFDRTGRELLARQQPGIRQASDRQLFELLTALAAPEAPRRAASGRVLSEVLSDGSVAAELGPFLSAFVELYPAASARGGRGLVDAADKLAPALGERVYEEATSLADPRERLLAIETATLFHNQAASLLAVDIPVLVAHTLSAGARRLAWLAGTRATP